ncbi:MAG: glycosyl transferase family 2 [Thermoplasmata archaeon]|nr:MAG: glycosyl transferase family 2 [Thermoplasmata archaeon]RLF35789.1 MAG: glycosyl transferase family 2 [Thermoplasmata archaeon]
MNQEWNKHLGLSQEIMEKCKNIKPVDILVGVLCKDVETTILNVLNVVNEGLYRYFPDYKKAIVVSRGRSSDKTAETIDLFQPYNSIAEIVTDDITAGGKGAGVRTIIEIAHEAEAKCVVLLDGDLLSIKPGWVQTISNPIIYGRADLTVPYYIRDKYDGVITNNLVYPFTRAVYGIDIRQPIAGEFGISKNLYETLREHPLFPPDFGVDIFIVTVAAAEGMVVKEGLFSLKIHESTTRYLEPEKFLVPMFRKVTGCMFELAKYYEDYWRNKKHEKHSAFYRECFSQKPIPVKIDIDKLRSSFKKEFENSKDNIRRFITEDLMRDLENIVEKDENFDPETWAEIVYSYAAAYKNITNENEKYILLDSLKTLWIGRFVSYAIETKDMDINEAEKVIQRQAEIFEQKFNYFLSIY